MSDSEHRTSDIAAAAAATAAATAAVTMTTRIEQKIDAIHTDVVAIKAQLPYMEQALESNRKRIDAVCEQVHQHLENPSKWSGSALTLVLGLVAITSLAITLFLAIGK